MKRANLVGEGSARALNRLAREQLKTKILADIATDMQVCGLEGWDHSEHAHDLHVTIASLCPRCKGGAS